MSRTSAPTAQWAVTVHSTNAEGHRRTTTRLFNNKRAAVRYAWHSQSRGDTAALFYCHLLPLWEHRGIPAPPPDSLDMSPPARTIGSDGESNDLDATGPPEAPR